MSDFKLFKAAGIRIIPVEEFGFDAVLVPDADVLLVEAHLTTEERRQIVCELLPEALRGRTSRP